MTTKDSGGIPPKNSHSTRQNAKRNEANEKLKKLHEGNVSNEKAASANAQMNEKRQNKEEQIESQSKPEYSPQGQMDHETGPEPNSNEKQSDEFESEPQSQEAQRNFEKSDKHNSNEAVDSDMPDASPGQKQQNSAPPQVSTQKSDDETDGKIERVLENFKELSVQDENETPEAFFISGRSVNLIVRCGPPGAAWYKVRSGNGYNTKGLQNVSDEDTRILKVKYKDEGGRKHRRYGRNNLGSLVAVLIVEPSNPAKRYKMPPRTYVKLEWHDIDEKDTGRLTDGCCWETRADLVAATEAELANTKIIRTWNAQEEDHLDYLKDPYRGSSVCPLDDFFKEKKERLPEVGLSTRMKEMSTSSSSSPSIGKSADPGKSKRTESEILEASNIKQEHDDDDLFVAPASPRKPKNVDLDENNQEEKGKPLEFSKKSYMKEMGEIDDWDDMDDDKRRAEKAIALANYHHYRKRMKELGHKEV